MITLQSVSKQFFSVQALSDINIEIQDGELIGILGPMGSGKTTLLHLVVGNIYPTKGKIRATNLWPTIGYQAQDMELPSLSVQSYLGMIAQASNLTGTQRKNCVADVVVKTGLQDVQTEIITKLPENLQQRVAIAQALIGNPTCILLDEPFKRLEYSSDIKELLRTLSAEGRTILVASENIDTVTTFCSRLLILSNGELIYDDWADGRQLPTPSTTFTFNQPLTTDLMEWIQQIVPSAEIDETTLKLPYNTINERKYILIHLLQNEYELVGCQVDHQTVEKLYQEGIQP